LGRWRVLSRVRNHVMILASSQVLVVLVLCAWASALLRTYSVTSGQY
jgi:hypothetical protein